MSDRAPSNATLKEQVWSPSQETFRSKVLDPHFERLARTWTRWHAAPETLSGHRTRVMSGVLPDPENKSSHELDVVVVGRADDGRERILAVGEAKSSEVLGRGHLARLERLREVLVRRDERADDGMKLLLFSGDVELVDLGRLYSGTRCEPVTPARARWCSPTARSPRATSA